MEEIIKPSTPPERDAIPNQEVKTDAPIQPETPSVVSPASNDQGIPIGVSASSLGLNQMQRTPLPKGVYVIAGLSLLSFLSSFFSDSNSAVYSVAMIINLLVAIGLFSRQAIARKLTLIIYGLSVVITVILIIGLAQTEARINQLDTQYKQAIAKLDVENRATAQQKAFLASMDAEIKSKRQQAGDTIHRAYAIQGVSLVVSIGVMIYLLRPKVKAVFGATG